MTNLGENQSLDCEHSSVIQQNSPLSITKNTKRHSSSTCLPSMTVKKQRKVERVRKPSNSRVYSWDCFMERNGTLCNTLVLSSSARRRSTLAL